MTRSRDLAHLLEIMAALRTPETGCRWDLAQDFATIVPFTIEEAYEVAEAVDRGDRVDLCDELGDLLLQVVFFARLAEEEGSFDFGDIVQAITAKLVRRHPHVFGPKRDLDPDQVRELWAQIKTEEKSERAARDPKPRGTEVGEPSGGALSGVSPGVPALLRALKLQSKAAKVGFDWTDPRDVVRKIREEIDEAEAALDDPRALEDEIGDLMFAVVNLARHAGVDPETALRGTNRKFERRFGSVEQALRADGRGWPETSLAEMERLWDAAKAAEPLSAERRQLVRDELVQPSESGGEPAPADPRELEP